ncbi:MAG: hypothetical protein QOF38_474 [Pseudonocardiales bacterium]|nr:hypothetical protein [Pseudonocardiales bacterium]
MDSAKNPNTGNRYSGSAPAGGPSSTDRMRCSGTKTSVATLSWLPVPRSPEVCQVSRTRSSAVGIASTRRVGCCADAAGGASTQPANSQSECEIALQNGHWPDTTTPPSTGRAAPRGAHTPAATERGSPNTSVAPFSGR